MLASTTPTAITISIRPAPAPSVSPATIASTAAIAPSVERDRRDDRDLADAQRLVGEEEPADVAGAGQEEPAELGRAELVGEASASDQRRGDDEADQHHPGEHRRGADQPRRARRAQRRRRPARGGPESSENGDHPVFVHGGAGHTPKRVAAGLRSGRGALPFGTWTGCHRRSIAASPASGEDVARARLPAPRRRHGPRLVHRRVVALHDRRQPAHHARRDPAALRARLRRPGDVVGRAGADAAWSASGPTPPTAAPSGPG